MITTIQTRMLYATGQWIQYQFLYKHSIEEDLLVAIISTYRYDGDEFDESVKSEANILHQAIENKVFSHNEIIRILSTRSKKELSVTFNAFRNIYGTQLQSDNTTNKKIDVFVSSLMKIIILMILGIINPTDGLSNIGEDPHSNTGALRTAISCIKYPKDTFLR
ncbi:hypothetical protein Lal_00038697 [Lupinus albus]|nr:hypothetical protein Lal_00038697 [Lupinus albus]